MLQLFEKAIHAYLLAGASITALVGQRVYIGHAPVSAARPYIVVSINALQDRNMDALAEAVGLINVQAVAEGETAGGQAAGIANAVYARLDDAPLALDAPWVLRRCEFESAYRTTDLEDGKRFHYDGGLYRCEADKG